MTSNQLSQQCETAVWLVEFRHKTKTPMYLAPVDFYVYAESQDDALCQGEQQRKALKVPRRWWTMNAAKTTFEELPR